MNYSFFRLVIMAISCTLLLEAPALARREKRQRPKRKVFTIKQTQFTVASRLTAGVLSGSAASDIERIRKGAAERMFYGLGVTVEYNLTVKSAIGLNTEVLWKKLPSVNKEAEKKPIRAVALSGSWLLNFSSLKRNSVYARVEMGSLWAKIPEYFATAQNGTRDLNLGRRSFFRIGLGLLTYTGPTTATRIEIYHKRIFSNEFPVDQLSYQSDPYRFDITSIGLELALGFGL